MSKLDTAKDLNLAVVKAVCYYTVETSSGSWLFGPSRAIDADRMFDSITMGTELMKGTREEAVGGTCNLIAWDRHPCQEGALGLILRQYKREEE